MPGVHYIRRSLQIANGLGWWAWDVEGVLQWLSMSVCSITAHNMRWLGYFSSKRASIISDGRYWVRFSFVMPGCATRGHIWQNIEKRFVNLMVLFELKILWYRVLWLSVTNCQRWSWVGGWVGGGGGGFGLPIFQFLLGVPVTYFKFTAIVTASVA